QGSQCFFQRQVVGQSRTAFPQTVQQARLRFLGGGFDVNGQRVLGQTRQQPRLHQGRLATARWTTDQSHRERLFGVCLFYERLPKTNTVGQSFPVARTGQQLQEEIGIVSVEGPQPFRHD